MFIYNVTTQVSWAIHEAWVQWMVKQHIPDVLATDCFVKHQLVRLLDTDETVGPTYAVQYFSHTKDDYTRYIELHATLLREESFKRWGDNFISFRSLMEVVN
jgi:hypothetical protein